MFDVAAFLDRARHAAGDVTDYRLAKIIGVTPQTMSGYRTGHRAPDERAIESLCKLSGDDPEHVAACIQAMRAANDDVAADLWRRVAARLQKGFASVAMLAVVAVFSIAAGLSPVQTAAMTTLHALTTPLCIMLNQQRT